VKKQKNYTKIILNAISVIIISGLKLQQNRLCPITFYSGIFILQLDSLL